MAHRSERALLSISAVNDGGRLVGHLSVYDYPDVSGIDATRYVYLTVENTRLLTHSWETELCKVFELPDVNPSNTLFLRLLVAEPGSTATIYEQLLR